MAVAKLSVYSNTALVVLKVVVGLMMGSVAVLSEAIHSGIDLLAALIARYSVKMSAEPADKDHRYGHGKYENLSGAIEGALIFVAAAWIIYEALNKLFDPEPIEIIYAGIAVMGVSAVLNYLVSRRLSKVAKKTDSLALEADAYHLTTDVWTSVGVFIALVLIWATGIAWLDPLVALVVAAFIIHAAYDITTRSTHGLLDRSLPEAEIKLIERIIKGRETAVLNFHKLRARKMGSERQIDVHMVVPRNLSVKEGHDLVSDLEKEIKKELPGSVIVIHIEPCDANCARCRMTPEPAAQQGDPDASSECRPKD
ncbi:MAG: cation diffusion facilitator family transporter [Thermoplasmata archaeon]|nr:cation diffusion facilitator family transporter [Thermoplasmata archaeon]